MGYFRANFFIMICLHCHEIKSELILYDFKNKLLIRNFSFAEIFFIIEKPIFINHVLRGNLQKLRIFQFFRKKR